MGTVTPTQKREAYLAFSRPYLELPAHIVAREDVEGPVSLQQLQGKKVAVVKGYVWQEFLERDYPGIELELVADVPTGLTKVSFGGATAMIVNLAVASHYIQALGLTNLRVSGRTEYYGRYAFATRNDWPELSRILDKALLQIGSDQRAAILANWIAPATTAAPTEPQDTAYPEQLIPEDLRARIEAIERDSTLDTPSRERALEQLRRALTRQAAARRSEQKAARFASSLESAHRETERIRLELSTRIAVGEPSLPSLPAGVTLPQLEQRLAQAKAELASAQQEKADLADQIKTQQGRPPKIQDDIAEAKLALDRLQWELAAPPDLAPDSLVAEARAAALQAEKDALRAEIHLLEQELLSYDVRLELLIAQYNRSQLELSRNESEERQLQSAVNALFADEAAAARQKAETTLRQVAGKHPLLQAGAKENDRLSRLLSDLAARAEEVSAEKRKVRELLTELDRDFRSIEQQLEIAAHSPVLAQVLIAERRKLPNRKLYEHGARQRRDQIANARLQQFLVTEQQQRAGTARDDSEPLVDRTSPGEHSDALRDQLGQLTVERSALLGKLADAYGNLATQLTALGGEEKRLADLVARLTTLLSERLLWTASTTPIGLAWIEQTRQAADWLLGWDNWATGVADFAEASTRSLLRAAALILLALALWYQWADVAPAGRLLDQITLWQQTVGAEGEERLESITLWALTKTVLVILVTLIAVQNLPGFLEISLLQRLSLDRGSRYAITAVSRYLIITLGVVVAANLIGFGWSKVQWLVAALTVGLGFGLQEIFANFVSGIIVLFERPIRIGDTVTVGTTTGTVTRISTRATTITDWDRKELIIPNKSFVTGDVINWTLSDPITRLILRIGVAYGTDVELTESLLRELAEAHPMVLDDPPPSVFFCGFGESALELELRVFFRDVLKRTLLTHELNKAINRSFVEHDIEIAFPQRDIHIRSVAPRATLSLDEEG